MHVVVPFDARDPKTRLSSRLSETERQSFAREMALDVCDAVRSAGQEPTLLATAAVDADAPVTVDDRPLTAAVNAVLDDHPNEAVAVVMADLPLLTPDVIRRLLDRQEPLDGDQGDGGAVTIAPGRAGGTNALVVRSRTFRVDYHGVSYRDHCGRATTAGATVAAIDSFRLATDVDAPSDLIEVVLHGDGHARDWLVDAGFAVVADDGAVDLARTP